MSHVNEWDDLLVCPYNKAHAILRGRMQRHLFKCRPQHPSSGMAVCPFDSTHHFPAIELELHKQFCSKRILLDSFVSHVEGREGPKGIVPINSIQLPEPEENWEEEDMAPSVLDTVKKAALDKNVLRPLVGAPKAERKAHKFNERLRIQKVTSGTQEPQSNGKPSSAANPQRGIIRIKEEALQQDVPRKPKKYLETVGDAAEPPSPIPSEVVPQIARTPEVQPDEKKVEPSFEPPAEKENLHQRGPRCRNVALKSLSMKQEVGHVSEKLGGLSMDQPAQSYASSSAGAPNEAGKPLPPPPVNPWSMNPLLPKGDIAPYSLSEGDFPSIAPIGRGRGGRVNRRQ